MRSGKIRDGEMLAYRASTRDCAVCPFNTRCCPKEPSRKILRSRERKRVEMLFAHLKRILRLGRLRLRGPRGAQFEFTLAAIAQNLRRLARLAARPPPAVAACVA